VIQVLKVFKVQLVRQAGLVLKVFKVTQAQLAGLDHKAFKVQLAQQAQQAHKVQLVLAVQLLIGVGFTTQQTKPLQAQLLLM
jgi:hypothetical protein